MLSSKLMASRFIRPARATKPSSSPRRTRLGVEQLEQRELLAASILGAPTASVLEGTRIALTGTASDPHNAAITPADFTYQWTVTHKGQPFATGSGSAFSFTPNDTGAFSVVLATNDATYANPTVTAAINATQAPPTASISGALVFSPVGTAVRLTGSATTPDAVLGTRGFQFAWSVLKNGSSYATGTGPSFSYTPNTTGPWVVNLTATDSAGNVSAPTTGSIIASHVLPTAAIQGQPSGNISVGSPLTLGGVGSSLDVAMQAAGFTYQWTVSDASGRQVVTGSNQALTYTPTAPGVYSATLVAIDRIGVKSVGTTAALHAINAPATIGGAPATVPEFTPVNLSASATDPNHPGLQPSAFTYAWTVTRNGTTVASGTGLNFSFVPNTSGAFSVSVVAADSFGFTSSPGIANVNVTHVSPTVILHGIPAGTIQPSPLALSANVTHPEPAIQAAGFTYLWSVTLGNQVVTSGTSATLNYTPFLPGAYNVTLSATDATGAVGRATGSFTVGGPVPTAALHGAPVSTPEGTAVTVTGSATSPNAVLQALGFTYSWTVTHNGASFATGSGASFTFTPVPTGVFQVSVVATDAAGDRSVAATAAVTATTVVPTVQIHGVPSGIAVGLPVTLTGSATHPDPAIVAAGFTYSWQVTSNGSVVASGSNPTIAFTPQAIGTYSVSLSARDHNGDTGVANATFQVVSNLPAAHISGAPASSAPNSALTLTASATDPDPSQAARGFTYAWTATENGRSLGSGSGSSFAFTPSLVGVVTVTLTAMDSKGLTSAPATATISVVADQVTAAIGAVPPSNAAGTTLTLTGSATDSQNPGANASSFTYTWSVVLNNAVISTSASRVFSYTPHNPGTYSFVLMAANASGISSNPASASTLVTGGAPTVSITGVPATGTVGTAINLGSSVTDSTPALTAAGFTYAWTVTENGNTIASGQQANINFTPASAGAYVVTLAATDTLHVTGTSQVAITVIDNSNLGNPPNNLVVLPAAQLLQLRREAIANTPQWQAFKTRLDQNLTSIMADYEGSELPWIEDYALGYQVLQTINPVVAANYADKALGILKSALNDYQKGVWAARQFLAQGDGSTTTYTLPNADAIPGTVQVFVAPVTTVPVVHGAANGQDPVAYYGTFLGVSNTANGPANYTQGVDWAHNAAYQNNMIDWSLGSANQPRVGATYYVSYADESSTNAARFTLHGNQITLATPLAPNQALYVQYIYGTHSANGSTLAYQQTSAGDGGFNSILVDDSYTGRNLGQYVGIGLSWLNGYAGFSPAVQTKAETLLTQWFNYLPHNAFHYDFPMTNYGAGAYASQVISAVALQNVTGNASQMVANVLAYRTQNLLPAFLPGGSLNGGYYPDGWNYGQLAAQNIMLAGKALADSGLADDTPEKQWASQVIDSLIYEQPSAQTIFDGGDWYAYPSPFPSRDLIPILSNLASDPTAQSYANYILQNYSGEGATHDGLDLLFRSPSASASFWSSMPLAYMAQGAGLLTARSDWGANPTWLSVQMGNIAPGTAWQSVPGQVQIQRGADDLLINASAPGGNQANKSPYANIIVVDSNGNRNVQTYSHGMGVWYGSSGVVINAYQATPTSTYLYGNYGAAYSPTGTPGSGGPVSNLTRQVVYLNPNYVVVYDNVTTTDPTYLKEQQWTFNNAPQVNGTAFTETAGSSKLFGQTYSTVPLTATESAVNVNGATIQALDIKNTAPTATVQYVTAFQVAPSSTGAMDATQHIVSTDSRMEGVEIGNQVVLFGKAGNVDLTAPVTYQVTGNGPVQQMLTNLAGGRSYRVLVAGQVVATLTATSAGTITFSTTPSGTQNVTVQAV